MIKTFTQFYGIENQATSRHDYTFEVLDNQIGGKYVLLFDNDKAYRFASDYFTLLHNWDIHLAAKHFNGVLYYASICRDTEKALAEYEHRNLRLPEGVIIDYENTHLAYFPSVEMLRSYIPQSYLSDYPVD